MSAIVCSFSLGSYTVRNPSRTRTVMFDESEQFGPSLVDMRTGDLKMIPVTGGYGWFWRFYKAWRDAGRPTEGVPMNTPNGPLHRCAWPEETRT